MLAGLGRPRAIHDPGRVLVDLAVAVADGAECISDVAVLADQPALFGPVASDSTVWRLLDQLRDQEMAGIAAARAAAREIAWAQRAEVAGTPVPMATAAGAELPGLVIDVDASIVVCHSEKEQAAATFKHSFGYHPILAFLDNSGEFLAGLLRPGNAGANTAIDHITVLDQALAQIPDAHRHGVPVLVRADGAGCSKAFLAHIRGRRDQAVRTEFSVGWAVTDRERDIIARLPVRAWTSAIDADGRHRDGADVAELTGLLPAGTLADYPAGTRCWSAGSALTPAPNSTPSNTTTGGAISAWPPTPASDNWRSSTPATAPTPGSRTASAPARTLASAGSPAARSRSTPPG